jgi:cysteinyl-tRNA synthetase
VGLRIYNTLTRQKEPFVPLVRGRVGMYVCGITPYDMSHIGHARSALVFDVVRRYLVVQGYRVTFVKNYTDIDDKIIARAKQLGISTEALAERYMAAYDADMAKLGVIPPTTAPRATRHIPEMVALVERLLAVGVAYAVDGGVYFEVRRFPSYGRLSGKNLDELLAGARVEVDARKRDPRDFALWKAAKPGEPSWPSPWGPGRPGWHIECSAMAGKYLGESFDLHGGGEDLIFPHHECEIAQSEAATGQPFVRYWIHNGFVNLGTEKMSKSLGNVLTIEALLARHDPEALRLYLLQTHYRNPVELSEEGILGMRRPLNAFRGLVAQAGALGTAGPEETPDPALLTQVGVLRDRFLAAMDDDFNTPQALGVLFDLARLLQGARTQADEGGVAVGAFLLGVGELVTLARSLGLLLPGGRPARSVDPQLKAKIESLLYLREEARKQRDFAEADRLRGELTKLGVTLKDSRSGGTTWTLGS